MTFNLGHLLQIASLIIAGTVGWMVMDARTSSNAARLVILEKDGEAGRIRLRTLEAWQAQGGARFDALYQSLQDVKQEQRDGNNLLRELLQKIGDG